MIKTSNSYIDIYTLSLFFEDHAFLFARDK